MKHFVIISGGTIDDSFADRWFEEEKPDAVIAADAGMEYLYRSHRVPDVIDIAGFTRITENSIRHSIALSGLPVKDWFARKEYTENKRPQLHLYVEMERMALPGTAVSVEILRQQLGIYFKYLDSDYQDLQKILGVDPLNITLVRCGTFAAYAQSHPKPIRKMNPGTMEVADFLKMT